MNIVGDKSTGKTLLAIEACANFALAYPKGRIRYREVEAAFDPTYARRLGLPVDRIELPSELALTVEDVFEDMQSFIKKVGSGHGLYILDSLDALSDRAELEGGFGEASYGTAKAKLMSQLFRRLIQLLKQAKITVMIISQVRDNIGVTFGRKTTRSGGHALDFYASQILYLAHIKTLKRVVDKIERPTGILVRAKCDKNKVGPPFRECEFPILFGFGIDDMKASADWLIDVGADDPEVGSKSGAYMKGLADLSDAGYRQERKRLAAVVRKEWARIEENFEPTRSKYGD